MRKAPPSAAATASADVRVIYSEPAGVVTVAVIIAADRSAGAISNRFN